MYVSSRSTLERSSSYFSSLLSRWDDSADEPLFIDADADAFQVLLSYMRIGTLTLPQKVAKIKAALGLDDSLAPGHAIQKANEMMDKQPSGPLPAQVEALMADLALS